MISIHAPREGGDHADGLGVDDDAISIHAPREGGDFSKSSIGSSFCRFQSTPPARGATTDYTSDRWDSEISIHAPREGGDCD